MGNEKIDYALSVSDGKCKKVSDCSEKLASWSCDVSNTNLTATLIASVGEFHKTLRTSLGQFLLSLIMYLYFLSPPFPCIMLHQLK